MKLIELRALAEEQGKAYRQTLRLIEEKKVAIRRKRQASCPHTNKHLERDPGYFDPGKMSHPLPDTVYRTCSDCGLRLEVEVEGKRKFVPVKNKR